MNGPIDIVILWVNDQDKKWQEKKKEWQIREGIEDNQEERYRDWDNLHYLFRGIEKYASWVNQVFLVTDNQKPSWLNEDYEKVTVVDHTEIIDSKYLPTFNSRAIELNIHKIKGLSENFVYFNDDLFIIDKTKPTDFFINNIPRDIGIRNVMSPTQEQIHKVIYNNLAIINKEFKIINTIKSKPINWINIRYGLGVVKNILLLPWNSFTGFIDPHISISYNKLTFKKVWRKYELELTNTTKSKFRKDYNYNQWLMRYWQLASNNFIPRKRNIGTSISVSDDKSIDKSIDYISNQKGRLLCVNDNEELEDFMLAKNQINRALEKLFPSKSKFEI